MPEETTPQTPVSGPVDDITGDEAFAQAMAEGSEDAGDDATPTQDATQSENADDPDITVGGVTLPQSAWLDLEKAGNIHKAATEKFQEAARIKEEFGPAKEFFDMWEQGPEAQKRIIEELQKMHTAAVGQPNQATVAQNVDLEDMTDTERALYAQIQAMQAQLTQFTQSVSPVITDLRGFVDGEKTSRKTLEAVREIKAKHGIDFTPEQVMQFTENGITDPVKAMDFIKPMLGKAFNTGQQAAVQKPAAPSGHGGRTFDASSSEISGDEAFKLMMKGYVPV